MKSYKRVAEDKQQLQQFADEATTKISELETKSSGTKLYLHSCDFSSDSSTGGTLLDDVALPLYIVSTRQEPYVLNDFQVKVPYDGVISISCDGGVIFSFGNSEYDDVNDRWNIQLYTGLANGDVTYENVTLFKDTVTPL